MIATLSPKPKLSQEETATDGVSNFLEQLSQCLKLVPANEWDLRKKQKKEKMRLASLPPANQLARRDSDEGSKKLKIVSPSQRYTAQP